MVKPGEKKTVLTTGQFTQCLALNETPGGGAFKLLMFIREEW